LLAALINTINSHIVKENADKTLSLINTFSTIVMQRGGSFNDICQAVTTLLSEIYLCTNIGVIAYNDNKKD
jgi:hypothetical protein